MKKKKGFTLIELIAVLVILAILALIVTPLVLGIIKKARVSADKRSIDAYGRSVEIAVASYLLDNVDFPKSFDDINIEYRGEEVKCANIAVNNDGSVYLDKCTVGGRIVKDANFASGYYTVGYASLDYMFYKIQDIDIQNIDHNNGSSSSHNGAIHLNGTINYNGILYYEVPNVTINGNYRLLIKATPLTYEEVVKYSGEIAVDNLNGIGLVAYYESDTCKQTDVSGCNADYDNSNVKKIVDAWAKNLKDKYALITLDDLLKAGFKVNGSTVEITDTVVDGFFKVDIPYWTMTKVDGSNNLVYAGATKFTGNFVYTKAAIRPVVVIDSNKLKDLKDKVNNGSKNTVNTNNQNSRKDEPNPYTVDKIIMYILSAIIIVCLIVLVIYLNNKDNKKDTKKKGKKK